MHNSIFKNLKVACLQVALTASLSVFGGPSSYYRTRRGGYTGNKQYLADPGLTPFSSINFYDAYKAAGAVGGTDAEVDLDFHFEKGQKIKELLIVDGAVQNKSVFLSQDRPGVDVIEIETGKSGIVQLLATLTRYSNLEAVHVISHATSGKLQLGNDIIDAKTFEENVSALVALNGAIKPGGDLLFYGCELAKGADGERFLEVVKGDNDFDIAASNDLTGNDADKANWDLEIQTGDIEATPLPESIALKDFTGTLQFTGNIDFSQWVDEGDFGTLPSIPANTNVGQVYTSVSMEAILQVQGELHGTGRYLAQEDLYSSNGEDGLTLSFTLGQTFTANSIDIKGYTGYTPRTLDIYSNLGNIRTGIILSTTLTTINLNSYSNYAGVTYIKIKETGASGFYMVIDNFNVSSVGGAVNADPTVMSLPTDVTVTEDTQSNVDLSGTTFGDTDSDPITVSLTVSGGTWATPADGAAVGSGVTEAIPSSTEITLEGSPADINTYLTTASNLQYTGPTDAQGNDVETITVEANDGDGSGDVSLGTVNIDITNTNDAPTVMSLPTDVTVTEDAQSNVSLSGTTFGDIDSDPITVTLTVSDGTWATPADGAAVGSGVTEALASSTEVTLAGSPADINTYLTTASNLQYTGPSDAEGNDVETITVEANDGDGSGDVSLGTVNIDITNTNDAPTVMSLTTDVTVTEDAQSNVSLSGTTFGDIDSNPITVTLTVSDGTWATPADGAAVGSGVTEALASSTEVTLEGSPADINTYLTTASNLQYTGPSDAEGNDVETITVEANDGDGSGDVSLGTVNIDITNTNDAPTVMSLTSDVTVDENILSNVSLSGTTFGDIDSNPITVTLTVSDGTWATPADGAAVGSGVTEALASSTEITLAGSPADINTYLTTASNLQYTGPVSVSGNDAETITVEANDGDGSGDVSLGTVNIDINAGNADPTVMSLPSDVTVTEDAQSNVNLSGTTFGDTDSDPITVTLTVSDGTWATPADGSAVGSGVTEALASSTEVTLAGSPADINTYLTTASNLQYTGPSDAEGNDVETITVTANDGDGSGDVSLGTVNIDITNVNDDPTVMSLTTDVTVTEDAQSNVSLSGTTFGDIDSDPITVTLTVSDGTWATPADGAAVGSGVTEALASSTEVTLAGSPADINTYLTTASNLQYTGPSDVEGNDVETITVEANDGDGSGDVSLGTVNIDITNTNDAPTVMSLTTDVTVTEDAQSNVSLSGTTFGDIDSDPITVTLTVSDGTWATPADGAAVGSGVTEALASSTEITLEGSPADINTYLTTASNLQYTGPSDAEGNDVETITVEANDGDGSGDVSLGTVNIDITNMNDAPTVMSLTTDVTVTEDAQSNVSLSGTTFGDIDSDPITVTLTVSDGTWATPADGAAVGSGVTEALASSTEVTLEGAPADINTYLTTASNLQYTGPSDAEGNDVETITVEANDGDGSGDVSLGTVNIDITNTNDAPTVMSLTTDVTVTEDVQSNVSLSGTTFGDIDSNPITVTLTVSDGTWATPADGAAVGSGVTEALASSTEITLEGSPADINTYLTTASNLQYTGPTDVEGNDVETITVEANDGDGSGDVSLGTVNIDITAVNDAPVVTNSGGTTSFTEGNGLTTIDVSISLTDADHTTLPASATATVSITGGFETSEDVLAFTNSNATLYGDAAASYNSGTGVLSITTLGATTVSQLQDVLRAVQYNNTSSDPNESPRTITFQANDGTDPSNSDTKTLNVFGLNTAPTFTITAESPINYSEGLGAVSLWQSATGAADAIESGQEFVAVSIEVADATDGSSAGDAEALNVDGTDITLDNGNSGSISAGTVTTASGETISYSVSRSGNDATVALTGFSLTSAEFEDLIEAITYENTSASPTIANRVATINFIKDSGLHDGTFDIGEANPNQTSTVTFIAKDTDSNLARLAGGEQTSEIDYTAFQGADGDPLAISGSPNVVSVLDVRITDSGTDVLPTIPTSITVDILNSDEGEIRAIGIFDGTTLVGSTGSITASNAISISGTQANSGGTLDLTVAVSFVTTVTDNNQFEFDISAVSVASSGSSTFTGGSVSATSTTNAGDNTIGVIASKVVITSIPTTANTNTNFTATLEAQDANDNIDVDFSEVMTVSINSQNTPSSPAGNLSGTDSNAIPGDGIQDDAAFGVYSWTDLQLDQGASYTLLFATSTLNVTSGTIVVSGANSDIVEDTGFDYFEDIDYFSYQSTDEPTILFAGSNSLEVGQFLIRDGGASAETDGQVTRITALSFDLDAEAEEMVAEAALFTASGTQLGSEQAGASTVSFSGFTLDVADGTEATVVLKVTFQGAPTITDGAEMTFSVNTITDDTGGSRTGIADNTPAGIDTDNYTGGDNQIDVIADELIISSNDPAGSTFERVTGTINPTIRAVDSNGNVDTDETSPIEITGSGSPDFDGAGATSVSATLAAGEVSPSFEIHNELTNITLTFADDGGPMISATAANVSIDDTTAPTIDDTMADLSPQDGQTGVVVTTSTFTMTFDEDVAIGTGDINIVLDVFPPELITIDVGDVSVLNNVATITLPSLLKGSGNYYVTVDAGAFTDAPNNAAPLDFAGFTTDTDWTFITATDGIAPTLTITREDPATGTADGTNSNTIVYNLEFSEEIDVSTFGEDDIDVTLTGTTIGGSGTSQTADLIGDATLTNSGDDINFTLTINNVDGDGTIGIEVGPNIDDLAAVPNSMAASVTSADFTIDNTASGFDAITITSDYTTNTLANTGNVITLVLDFDEDQSVAPTIDFASGGDVVNAGTVTAVETNAGTFEWTATYTVDALDTDGAVTYDINFTDAAENAGSTDETNGAVSGSVTVDRGAPTIERLEVFSDNATNNDRGITGNTITIEVEFDEDAVPSFTNVESGGAAFADPGPTIMEIDAVNDIWQFTYVVDAGDTDGTLTFDLNFDDTAGNSGAAATQADVTDASSMTIDNTTPNAPTVTIASDNGTDNLHASTGDVVTITLDFDEDMEAVSVDALQSGGVNTTNAAIVTETDAAQDIWTAVYTVAGGDTEGDVTFSISFDDAAGNAEGAAITEADLPGSSVEIDLTAPTLEALSITSNNGTDASHAVTGNTVTLTMDFDDDLSANPVVSFTSNSGAVNNTVTVMETDAVNDIWTATYTVSALDNDGQVNFTLDFDDDTGLAGATADNTDLDGGGASQTVEIDNTAPAIEALAISSDNGTNNQYGITGNTVTIQVDFDDDLSTTPVFSNVQSGGVAINDASPTTMETDAVNDIWTFTYTVNAGDTDGALSFDLDFTDDAGNAGTTASETDVTNASSMTIDNLAPTVVVTDDHVDPDDANDDTFKQGDVVTITATFTEANSINGTPTIVIGTSVGSTAMSATADDLVWTYDWTVPAGDDASELVTISATDVAGNAIGTQTNTNAGDYEIDNTAPDAGSPTSTVTIASNNAVSTAGASVGDDVILSFTASETLSGDPTVVFQSDNANVQDATSYTNTAGDDWEARYTVDAADQSGAISFTLDFTDVAGNAATQILTVGDGTSVTVDSNVPTISSIDITPTLGSTSNTGDNTAVFVITFSEGVGQFNYDVGVDVSDITINTSGVTFGATIDPVLADQGGGVWHFTISEIVGDGTLSIDVNNNGTSPIIDASGNTLPGAAGVEASSTTVTFDQTDPGLSPVTLSTNNSTDNQHATAGDIVTLSFTADDALSTTPTVNMFINGTAVVGAITVNDLGSNMYTATYAIDGTGTTVGTDIDDQGAFTFTIDFTDDAGNAGTQVTSTTDATSVEVDFTVPTLTTVTLISDNGTDNQHAAGGNTILLDVVASDVLSALPEVVLRSGGLNVVGSVTVAHDNPGAPDFQNFNITYTVDGTGSTGGVDKDADGDVTFFLDFEDDAGNTGTQVTSTTNGSVMEIDVTAPTLSGVTLVSSQTASESFVDASHGTTGNLVTLSFTVDDDLSAAPSVNLQVGGANVTPTINAASAPTYTATYTLLGTENDGAVSFTINYTDDAGNAGSAVSTTTDASSIEADFIAPTLTSVSLSTDNSTDNQHATTGDEITLSFTADDDLSAAPGVTMSIGGTGVTPTVNDLGSNNYSATYMLIGSENEGAVTFTIDFIDDAGISGMQVTATTDATSVEADFNAPTLTTVSIASSQTVSETFVNASHAADGNTVTIDIVSSDVLSAIPTVTVRSGNIDVQGPVTVAHDNPGAPDFQNFNVTYAVDGVGTSDGVDKDADGDVTFFINFVDDAGISGTQVTATTDATTVEVDNTAPTLSSVTLVSSQTASEDFADASHGTTGNLLTLTFIADDDLSATPTVSFDIAGTVVAPTVNTGSAPTYTATYTLAGTENNGTIDYTIDFTDDAGNAGATVNVMSSLEADFIAPTLSTVSLSTNNSTDNQHATTGDVITLSFTMDDDLSSSASTNPAVTMSIGGTGVTPTVNDLGSNNYSATYMLIGSENEGAVTFTIDFIDDAGISGTQVTATTDATSVEADFNAPTLTTVSIASSQTTTETFVNASHAADGNTVTIDIVSSDVLSAIPTVTVRSGNIDVQGPVTVAHDNPGAPDFQNFNVTYAVDGVGTSDGVDKDADGDVTFFINFVDDAGISGTQVTATTDATTVEVDNTAPTLSSVTLVSSQTASEDFADASHGTTGNLLTLTFIADDDLSATPTVSFDVAGTVVAPTVNTGSAPTYTATYTLAGTENNGTIDYTIDFTDDAGNAGATVNVMSSLEADFIAPTLSTVSLSTNNSTDNQHATTGDVITLSFTMDDDLSSSASTNPAVTMSIGGTGVTPTVNDLGSNNYSATYMLIGSENEGAVTFTIDFIDDAGISGTQVTATTDATSVEADFNAPTLTTVSIASSQTTTETFVNASHAADGNTVTIDIVSSDVLSAIPTVTVRSGNIDVQGPVTVAHDNPGAPDFQNFNVTYAVDGVGTSDGVDKDADGDVTFFINFVDDAGISGTQVSATTDATTVEVDNTAPTLSGVTLVSSQTASEDFADASHGTTGNLLTLTFIADDDLSATPTVSFDIAGTVVAPTVNTGSAPTYTATYTLAGTENDGTIDYTIDFTDDAGNAGATVNVMSSLEADFIAPTLSTVSLSTNNSTDNQHATTGDEITLSFTMDDDLSSSATTNPAVTMSIGGTGVTPTLNDLGSNNYSATYTLLGSENEGAVTFTIDFIDDAGISGTQVTATTDATSVEADFNAPTLTTVSIASSQTVSETFVNASHAADGNTVTIDIVSSDVLSAIPTVTVRSGNIDVQGPVTVAHDNPGAPDFQNFNVTYAVDGVGTSDGVDKDADGDVTFFINFVDDAGISGTQVSATTDATTVEVDNTAPTLSSVTLVSSQTASEDFADASHGTTGNLLTLTFIADDDLSATPTVSFDIAGTVVAPTVNTGSAPTYTATYTLAGTENDGTIDYTIDFTDDAGNAGATVNVMSSLEADFIAPTLSTVSLSTNNSTDNQHATTGDEITLSFTMDDDLSSSATTNPAVTMSIGGTGVTPTLNDLGSNNYSATYTLLGSENEGAVTFTIDFIDDAGISGTQVTATTDATSVEADFNAPTLTTVSIASSQTTTETFVDASHAADGNTVTIDIVSSDVLSAIPTVTVRSGNIDVQGPVTVAHDNPGAPDFQNFNVTYAVDGVGTSDGVDKDADGDVTFFINFVDDAGISGTQVTATTDATTVEVDNTVPTLSSVTLVSSQTASEDFADASHGTTGNLITLAFTADDDLSATPVVGLSIGGTAVTATVNTGSAPNYTATYTLLGTENEGAITFTIDFTDDAGNAGTQVTSTTDGSSIEADFNAPTLTSVSLSTNNTTDNQHGTTDDVITLSWTMDDDLSSSAASNPAVTMSIGGTGVTPTLNNLGSNNYSATYTLQGTESEGAVTFTIDFIDDAGIAGTQVSATTDATAVEADFNAPTLTTVTLVSNNTTDNQHATDGDVVTLDIVSSDVLSALPTVTIRSGNIDVQGPITVAHDNSGSPDFQNFNVTYTVDGDGTSDGVDKDADGPLTFFINFVDDAGIAGTQVTATTDGSAIEVDASDPVIEALTIVRSSGTDNTSDNNDFVQDGDEVTITVDFNDDLSSGFPTISNLQSGGVAMAAAGTETITETDATNEVWTIVFNIDAGDTDGNITFQIDYNDDAGNTGAQVTESDITDGSSVSVDNTAPTSTISAAIGSSNTEIIVTFNENVATNGTNPTDFTVVDEDSNNYAVSAQVDDTAEDDEIVLTVADFSAAEGDLLVTYTNSNGEIFDLANNAAPTSSTTTIERTFTGQVSLTEIATSTDGDTDAEVAMYRTTTDGVNLFTGTPVTFTPSVEGSTITIYRDADLTDPVTGAQATSVTKASGYTPTIDVFLADEGLTLGGTSSSDYDADGNDINGVYTFYITETAVNETDSEGSSVTYSLAFLDDIDNTEDRINFSVGEDATTDLRVGNSLNQELQISGVAIGSPTTASGTSFVNSEATNITTATFNASIVGQGTYPLAFEWINATSDVSARFEDVITLAITPVVSPFFDDGQKINFGRDEAQQDLLVNSNPSGVDVATDTDGGDADFYDLEIYYVQNGNILTSIGSAGVNSSAGGEISTALTYSGTAQTFGTPSGAANTDWDIDPSAIDAFLDANVTTGRSVIDTLVIAYITANDNATSAVDLTVNTTTNLYLFEPVDDIVTQETEFATEYFTCEGDAVAPITTSDAAEEATYVWYADDGDLTFDAGDTEITRSTTLTNANILGQTTTYTAIDGTGQTTLTYTNDDGVNGTTGIYYFWVHHVRGATDDFLGTTSSETLIAVTVFDDATEPVFDSNTAVTAGNSNNVDFTLFYDAANLTESVTFSAASGGGFTGADFNPVASTSDVAAADTITNEFRWYTSNEDGTRGTQITSGATVTAQQLQLTGLTADADRYIYLEEVTNIVLAADGTTELYDGCTSNGVVILFSVKVKPAAPTGTTSFFYCEGETVADLTMNGEDGSTLRWLDVNNNLLFEQTANTGGAFTAGIDSDLGIGSTPEDSLYTIKVYQVSDIVSTTTNSSSVAPDSVNLPFVGAISDTTEISIRVRPIPASPVLDAPVNGRDYCDDVSTQLSIGFTEDAVSAPDLFRIYLDDEATISSELSSTQSAILFDMESSTYTAGRDSTIYISQVSFSGEGGVDFVGCESPLARVDVHPNPNFASFANGSSLINITEACEVGITAEISVENMNTFTESNYFVEWRVDDQLRSESNNFNLSIDEDYNAGNIVSLDISVEDQTTLCSAEISENRIIGVTPISDFTISNITEFNNTEILVRDNNPDVTDALVETISMDIVDDNDNDIFNEIRAGGTGSDILGSIFNNDFNAGSYTATMLTTSTSGCRDTVSLDFNILPQVTISSDTLIDFDRGNLESWFAEEDRNVSGELNAQNVRQLVGNSWELNSPDGNNIDEDPNGGTAIMWITNRSGEYNPNEVSYVYSPSFNVEIQRPAVSFDYYLDMVENDGVVLQISTDDGETWDVLGEPSTGVFWYNQEGVASNPGGVEGNRNRYAWAGDDGDRWVQATHAISGDNLTTLRFRFALGSRAATGKDGQEGFAFDNFRVFSRDRTTLLETFTSSQNLDNNSNNAIVATDYVQESFPGDVVVINYFTDIADEDDRVDPIFAQNPSDPNARLTYYGINSIETGVLGGRIGTDLMAADQSQPDPDQAFGNLGFVRGDFATDLLSPTSVDMALDAVLLENENTVDINLTVTTDYPEGVLPFDEESQLSTRVMILQQSVGGEGVLANVPGDVTFNNVLREIITGSSGISTSGMVIDDGTEFIDYNEQWEVSGIFANSEVDSVTMIVVAFVQDEVTREILQVVEQTVRVAVPETVTNIHPDFFSSEETYQIYPNPADNVFTVELEKPTMMDLNWILVDQTGKKVVVGDIRQGSQQVEVITDHLSSGLYFFQLYNNDHVWESQRVMIMKGSR